MAEFKERRRYPEGSGFKKVKNDIASLNPSLVSRIS